MRTGRRQLWRKGGYGRPRRQWPVGVVLCLLAALLPALLAPSAGAQPAEAPTGPASDGDGVELTGLPAAGPLQGLANLARHVALGDRPVDAGPVGNGVRVALVQYRLRELGYRPGPIDGAFGGLTSSAVLAFQKREGLSRSGVPDGAVVERLAAPVGAGPRSDVLGARIEVDLARQVMFVVDPDGFVTTLNTSTGNGAVYISPSTGGPAVARTPTGVFSVGYRINGPEVAPLGTLYRPMYFTGPFAVHGSGSVPAGPASHGCVRTSYPDQDWLWDRTPTGLPVYIY